MPPKGKGKKGNLAARLSPQRSRSKWSACKSQPLPVYSSAIGEDSSDLDRTLGNPSETETGLTGVMDMLMAIIINSRLQAIEHFMAEVKADKAADQHLGSVGVHLQVTHLWRTSAGSPSSCG